MLKTRDLFLVNLVFVFLSYYNICSRANRQPNRSDRSHQLPGSDDENNYHIVSTTSDTLVADFEVGFEVARTRLNERVEDGDQHGAVGATGTSVVELR